MGAADLNAAVALLDDLRRHHGRLVLVDGVLQLRAPQPLPADLIDKLAAEKPNLARYALPDWPATLRARIAKLASRGLNQEAAKAKATAEIAAQWLWETPPPIPLHDRCAHCGRDTEIATAKPLLVAKSTTVWIHLDCLVPFRAARHEAAMRAIRAVTT